MTYAHLVKDRFFGRENPNRPMQPAWSILLRHHENYCRALCLTDGDLEKLRRFGEFLTVVVSHENIFFFVESIAHDRVWRDLLLARSETGKEMTTGEGTGRFTTLYEGMHEKCIWVLKSGIDK